MEDHATHLNSLLAFLACRVTVTSGPAGDFCGSRVTAAALPSGVDVVVLCGNALVGTVDCAVAALAACGAPTLMIVGGVGHSTPLLYDVVRRSSVSAVGSPDTSDGRSEADILADIAAHKGLDRRRIVIERESTNCGQNAEFAVRMLNERFPPPSALSLVLLQDPTMQLRSTASFEKWFQGRPNVTIHSWAPFVPQVNASLGIVDPDDGDRATADPDRAAEPTFHGHAVWTPERLLELAVGEIPRLRNTEGGYGPRGRGFITAVDVPDAVVDAHSRLLAVVDSDSAARARVA
jgi:hypothetical protein